MSDIHSLAGLKSKVAFYLVSDRNNYFKMELSFLIIIFDLSVCYKYWIEAETFSF